jgi:hypothetical protein
MKKPKRLMYCCICGEPEEDVAFVKGTLCCPTCFTRHHNEARKIEASKAFIQKQQAKKATNHAKVKKAEKASAARYCVIEREATKNSSS